jgi:phytoene dehydrogenase-like protein
MKNPRNDVIIVGAGLAGLACARRLKDAGIPFVILDGAGRIGGRVKTDQVDGFLLDHGFQVLQTAYPEARRVLDYGRLELKPFAPGAIIRVENSFHLIADPRRQPRYLWSSATAPIGTLADRVKMIKLASKVRRAGIADLFQSPEMSTLEFLKAEGFSKKIIDRFFIPFFSGISLDPTIEVSSNVFQYILRIFSEGDVALPAGGMGAIPVQLAESLPDHSIRTAARVQSIHSGGVELSSGEIIKGRIVVLATEGPETARLLGSKPAVQSHGELCLYYGAKAPPIEQPFLILNGDRTGWINSLTVPSLVAPSYAPPGQTLISIVVIGRLSADDISVEAAVRGQLTDWFGEQVNDWRHLKTYRINHALPAQPPPMPNPTIAATSPKPGIFICGEYNSVPGIQWAMLSGRLAAEAVLNRRPITRSSGSASQFING